MEDRRGSTSPPSNHAGGPRTSPPRLWPHAPFGPGGGRRIHPPGRLSVSGFHPDHRFVSSVSLVSPPEQENLVRCHLGLAHHVVADMMSRIPRHVPRDELVSAALLGLVQAARTYDPDRGVAFERHARSRMQGAVLDDLRSRDWASRAMRARARKLRPVDDEFAMAFGRTPTPTEAGAPPGCRPPRSAASTTTSTGPLSSTTTRSSATPRTPTPSPPPTPTRAWSSSTGSA